MCVVWRCRIQRYSVIPLSTNSGLIGWVPNCDTLHSLIRDYREKKKILLNLEHRIMLRVCLKYFWLIIAAYNNCQSVRHEVFGSPLSILWSSFLACNSYDCLAPYVDIILHRGRFSAKSAALGSVRWCCFRSCWTVLSHMMRGRPSCLLQSARGEANRILLASALSSMHIICPNS